jgi:hypothetical protein
MTRSHAPRRTLILASAVTAISALTATASAAALPAGVYVQRVGGTGAFGAGANPADATTALPVYIDSFGFAASATPQLTLSLPTVADTGVRPLTDIAAAGGTTPAAVQIMQLSPDKRYLTLAGYDVAAGSGVAGTSKTIGVIDTTTGSVSTQLGFGSTAQPRSVVTVDTTGFWFVGSSNGIRYITPDASDPNAPGTITTISASNVNQRTGSIFGGQLFLSGSSSVVVPAGSGGNPGVAVMGTGTPTTTGQGQSYIMTTAANPEQFVMLDLDPATGYVNNTVNTGLDTTYVGTGEGVEKWTFNGTSWVKQYTLSSGLSADATSKLFGGILGLSYAGTDAAGKPILYATSAGTTTAATGQGNALLRLVDTGAGTDPLELVTASPDNTWFRGVQSLGSITPPAVPGDADGDGDADLDDIGIWATNFTGSLAPGAGTGTLGTGDFDGDKDVDLDDQGIWASNFTGSLAPGGIAAGALATVPEPASLAAACALALPALLARRRRRA